MAELSFQRIDDVVQREVAGEAFLVPIRGHLADLQELFVLNDVGHWLWNQLGSPRSLEDLVGGVVAEFEVDPERTRQDAEAFLKQLADAGLVRPAEVARDI